MIGEPPFGVGALKLMRTDVAESTRTALMLGALGVISIRPGAKAVDAGDRPYALIACTVNEYDFPGLRPIICAELIWAGVILFSISPGFEVIR